MPSPERNLEETNLDSVEMKKLLTGDSGAYGDEGPPQKELEEEVREGEVVGGHRDKTRR